MGNHTTLTCQFCNAIVRGQERQVERTWMPRRASIETHGRPPLYPCSLRFWSCPPSFKFQRVSATGASLPRHLEFQSDFKYSMVKTGSHFHTYIWSLETLTVNQWKIHSKLRRYQNYPQFLFNPSKLVTVAHTELGVSISDSYGEKKWKHKLTHPKSFNFSSEEALCYGCVLRWGAICTRESRKHTQHTRPS